MEREVPVQKPTAEETFFGGTSLEKSVAKEKTEKTQDDEQPERKFFGGRTLEERMAIEKKNAQLTHIRNERENHAIGISKAEAIINAGEKPEDLAMLVQKDLERVENIIDSAEDNSPELARAVTERNQLLGQQEYLRSIALDYRGAIQEIANNKNTSAQDSIASKQSGPQKIGRWFKSLFKSNETNNSKSMEREAPKTTPLTRGEIEQDARFEAGQDRKASEAEMMKRRVNDPEIQRLEGILKANPDMLPANRIRVGAQIKARAIQLEQEPTDDEDEEDEAVAAK